VPIWEVGSLSVQHTHYQLCHLQEENLSQQNCIGELKDEVNKLSGQHNLQQRIHHHTKIKVLWKTNQSLSLSLNKQIMHIPTYQLQEHKTKAAQMSSYGVNSLSSDSIDL
jgi:kinesin family protein 15